PIHPVTPRPQPTPISDVCSRAIVSMLDDRAIGHSHRALVTRLDTDKHIAHLRDGGELPCDLLLGIPVHRAPAVVVDSGLTDDGWTAVDPTTLPTKFPDIYAVGHIPHPPAPRAGATAEHEAPTVPT